MKKKGTILLVESDPNFARRFLQAVQRQPHRWIVRWVTGTHHAEEYLIGHGVYADRENYPKPDLLVLDSKTLDIPYGTVFDCSWRFPGANGTPIAVLGESHEPKENARVAGLGACCYFRKSKNVKEVQKTLREMLGKLLLDGSSD